MRLEGIIAFACHKHTDQLDKVGEPYILHPIRVMLSMSTPTERAVAILHDVLEDTNADVQSLRDVGCPETVVDAVIAITKVKGESYKDYLLRVSKNKIAVKVKRADISDNASPIRLYKMTPEKRIELRNKYNTAINILDSLEELE